MDATARGLILEHESEGRQGLLLQGTADGGFILPPGLPAADGTAERRFFTIPEIKELLAAELVPAPSRELLLAYLERSGHLYRNEGERPLLVGVIGRFRPVHLGHQALLGALCRMAGRVRIGIGSANRYGRRNPFTAEETREMIDAVLAGTAYEVVPLDDFGHRPEHADGARWRQQVVEAFAGCAWIVSGNPYVAGLLAPCFRVLHPIEVLAPEERIAISSSRVRQAMAAGAPWRQHVPAAVARCLEERGLVARLRREFPPQGAGAAPDLPESVSAQQARIRES